MRGNPETNLPTFSLSASGRLDAIMMNTSTTRHRKPTTATASGLPRFMQPTTSSKQSAAAASSPQSIPPQSGHLACTPVLNISTKPSHSSAESSSGASSTSSSKWKSSAAAGSRPVFSVITRGSRQPAKQPLQPTKPQPTASRISRPPSSSSSNTPQHSTSSKSLSLRGSTSTSSSSSARTPSTLGTTSSSGASTPVLANKLGASPAHARNNIVSSCSSSVSSTRSTAAAASTPPRSRDCRSLVRVLTFEDASDASTSSVRDQASTAAVPVHAHVQHSLKPHDTQALRARSRIPLAPGTAPATVACSPAAGKAAGVSTGGAGGGACTDAASTGARLAVLGDIAPDLLSQRDDATSDQDSSNWLSDGCSEERLQELAGGAGLPAQDALGLGGLVSSGSSAVCGGSTGPVELPAATRNVDAGGREEGSVLQAEQPVQTIKASGAAEGGRGWGRGLWGCMLVVWSLLLVGVGLLAAAALLTLQEPRPLAAAGGVFFAFADSDIGVLAGTAAGRFMV